MLIIMIQRLCSFHIDRKINLQLKIQALTSLMYTLAVSLMFLALLSVLQMLPLPMSLLLLIALQILPHSKNFPTNFSSQMSYTTSLWSLVLQVLIFSDLLPMMPSKRWIWASVKWLWFEILMGDGLILWWVKVELRSTKANVDVISWHNHIHIIHNQHA